MFDATPLLRLYARWRLARLARQKPVPTQQAQLRRLLSRARDTRFGRDHGFASIGTVEDFREAVPLRRYEDFWAAYWKDAFPVLDDVSWPGRVPHFALTSGTTTGTSKNIPVTEGTLAGNRRAVLDMLCFHLRHHPASRVLGGRNFMLGGSTALRELAPGVDGGDMSGLAAKDVPAWARPYYFPPPEIAAIADWETKTSRLAELSRNEDIRVIGGTASWLLLYLQRLVPDGAGGSPLRRLHPNLELVVYGGVNFAPYREAFEALVGDAPIDLREVYPASEGFIAFADRGVGEGLRMVLDNGLFYEFVPVEELASERPTRHWIGDAETGVNYALVLSNAAGMWGYVLGDTVRLVDRDPPRLLITGRISTSLSAFGEHLIEEELVTAVTRAAEAIGRTVIDFSVGALHRHEGGANRHLVIVEFAGAPPGEEEMECFLAGFDRTLADLNHDYAEYRENSVRIGAPEGIAARPGAFEEWMRARGRLGGQNKVPRVLTDPHLLESLRSAAREGETTGTP